MLQTTTSREFGKKSLNNARYVNGHYPDISQNADCTDRHRSSKELTSHQTYQENPTTQPTPSLPFRKT